MNLIYKNRTSYVVRHIIVTSTNQKAISFGLMALGSVWSVYYFLKVD
jgi:hypothetical protein